MTAIRKRRDEIIMIGAVIFIIFFLLFFAVTLGMPTTLPPGSMIHSLLDIPMAPQPVLGIPAWQLINASTNGVVWGFAVWLVFSIVASVRGRGKQDQIIQQTVTVGRPYSSPQQPKQYTSPQHSTQYVPPPTTPPPHHTPPTLPSQQSTIQPTPSSPITTPPTTPPPHHTPPTLPSQQSTIQPTPSSPITVPPSSEQPSLQKSSSKLTTTVKPQSAPPMTTSQKTALQQEFTISSENLVDKVKDLLHEGNVTRVIVKDMNGKILLDLPASVSIAGTIATPWLAGLGAIAALATKCTISVVRQP